MHDRYEDIMAIATTAGLKPRWWDENGCPRFAEHEPKHCPDIYADEVVLLRISCQGCDHEFSVQMSSSSMDRVRAFIRLRDARLLIAHRSLLEKHEPERLPEFMENFEHSIKAAAQMKEPSERPLAEQIRAGAIHYGDPPNVDCCPAGATMNCWDLRVLEYWTRGPLLAGEPIERAVERFEMRRVPELEVELPDMKDTTRMENL